MILHAVHLEAISLLGQLADHVFPYLLSHTPIPGPSTASTLDLLAPFTIGT